MGWSGRPRHVGEPEALSDSALSCVLILLSSASCGTKEGLRGKTRSEEGIEPVFHSAYIRLRKCQGSLSENEVEGASHTQI